MQKQLCSIILLCLEIVGHLYRFCGNNHMKFEDHAEKSKMRMKKLQRWMKVH
mgnify:CR=1 FL=1